MGQTEQEKLELNETHTHVTSLFVKEFQRILTESNILLSLIIHLKRQSFAV